MMGWLVGLAIAGAVLLAAAFAFRHYHVLRRLRPGPPGDAPEFPPAQPQAALPTDGAGARPPKVERTLPLGTTVAIKGPTEGIQVREPLLEADVIQAQGFYREIADLLTKQLEAEPARLDLHRTLLEVFRAAGQGEEYVRYAQTYYERSSGFADPHWEGIARAGRELLPGHELFDGIPGSKAPKKFQRFYETVSQIRLHEALRALSASYDAVRVDPAFSRDLLSAMTDGAHRPTPLTPMPLTAGDRAGATIYAKREDVRAANDDQLINAIGQTLLALRLGRRRVVTATGDGIHGLAVASVASRHGLECAIYMSEPDYRHHFARVLQMRRIGAEVRTVSPAPNLDAAWQAALQAWLNDSATSHFVSNLESGPHPFPLIVRDFQSVVGQEATIQLQAASGGAPSAVVAGVADGYVGLGLLHAFLSDERVPLYCVEPPEATAAAAGARFLREHSWLRATRRVQYVTATDDEAMLVIELLFRATGMAVSIESARSLAYARHLATAQEQTRSVLTLITSPEDRPLPLQP